MPFTRSPRVAILRPDSDFLHLLGADPHKTRSYSQCCRDWPEVKSHLAILLAPPGHRGGDPDQKHEELIWGLGIVRPAHETDRDRKVSVSNARRLRELVPASELWFDGEEPGDAVRRALPESGPVTVGVDILLANLQRTAHIAESIRELTPLLDDHEGWSDQELRWRDERDALLLFAKIAGVTAKDFMQVHGWEREVAGKSFVSGLSGVPVQLALTDVRGLAAERLSGVGEVVVQAFNSTGGRVSYDLEVTSVTARRVVGGDKGSLDAYYYHVFTGTLVILRYLWPESNALLLDAWHSLDELHRQIDSSARVAPRGVDYCFLEDPIFFRVHEQVPFIQALHRTSSGAIYPYGQVAGAMSVALKSGQPGLSFHELARHLVPTDFARLVRDGWLGTRDIRFDVILNWIEETIKGVGAALLVVDFSDRPRGNGAGLGRRS